MSDRVCVGDAEHRKLKRQMIEESSEPPTMDAKSEELLTLKLMVGEAPSSKKASDNEEERAVTVREFSCKFCSKRFRSSQALGGHQNAHRRERALFKIEKELDMGTFARFGPHLCPCSAMESTPPFRGSPFHGGAHSHMHPPAHMCWPLYGQQGLANSDLEAYRFGMRRSWGAGGEGVHVQRRLLNRRNNVQSSSYADANPEGSEGARASIGGLQSNSYMGNLNNSSSDPDLSLSL